VHIRLRLFAMYAEVFGRDEVPLDLPAGATVADALAAVRGEPAASRLPPSPLVAVNLKYAKPDVVLNEGDEVALIPPVAGG